MQHETNLSREMFEDVSVLLHAQDQAAAPIGQKLAHVDVHFESRSCCLEISAQQDAATSGRVVTASPAHA